MNKYVLGVNDMRCGMCEMHVEEAISTITKKVNKVKANRHKNEVVVFSLEELSLEDFKKALDPTGYRISSFHKEDAKKTLFSWR